MKDIYGNDLPIIEGHEQAFWILGAGLFVFIVYVGLLRHWKDVRRIMEARKTKPVLRPFHERDDPYQDDNNLGRF
jgi:hypothetical protein